MASLSQTSASMSQESQTKAMKKVYMTPGLLEYGSVAKLTQGASGSGADGGTMAGNMRVPPCL